MKMMNKAELRKLVKSRLAACGAAELARKSEKIRESLLAHPAYREAKVVALFAAQSSEPHLDPLHDGGKEFCFPRVHGEELEFYRVQHPGELVNGQWDLREPRREEEKLVALERIDLVLVPGMAFTKAGGRLGRGGGYYDRLLADPRLRAKRLGVCFDFQVLGELPLEGHDREVEEVVAG